MKQPNLFEAPDGLSPRLEWMKRHSIETAMLDDGTFIAYDPETFMRCQTYVSVIRETEDEALTDFAKANGLKLWNEEER